MLGACAILHPGCSTDDSSPEVTEDPTSDGSDGSGTSSSHDDSDEGAATGTDGGSEDDGGIMSDPDGPQIVSLTVNSDVLGEGDMLLVTVIVTDPDGIDDVIGGELRTIDGASYGAFVTAAQEGAYSLSVPWDQLHALEPIAGAPTLLRELRAHFFDQAAHETTAEIEITLACDDDMSFCDAMCFDLASDLEHCGECDNPANGSGQTCTNGTVACADEDALACGDECVPLGPEHCGHCYNDCTGARLPEGDWWERACFVVDGNGEQLPTEDWYCGVQKAFDALDPLDCNDECGVYECVLQYGYYGETDEVVVEACDATIDADGLDYKGCICAT